jgi:uncharacterized repeat protein (TIGR03803 family)
MALAAGALLASARGASASTYKVIHDFCSERLCADGQAPMSGVIMDAAGVLYGTTQNGGSAFNGPGVAYQLVPNADRKKWKSATLYKFATASGTHPQTTPILDAEGNLYGTTFDGGTHSAGTIYRLSHHGSRPPHKLTVLYALAPGAANPGRLGYQGAAAGAPYDGRSPLILAARGASGHGFVFKLKKVKGQWQPTIVYDFCSLAGCQDGSSPVGAVTVDANGNVFGTTTAGGAANQGVVYELTTAAGSWTESVLHNFCQAQGCLDGTIPSNALVADATGTFYSTTTLGGAHHGNGTIFSLTTDGTYNVVYSFCAVRDCKDGVLPLSDLILDSGGALYGVTTNGGGHDGDANHAGGGSVFALKDGALTTLYSFCAQPGCIDGEYPMGGLTMDAQGNLFGTTSTGGKYGAGVVFELSP